MVSEGEFCRIFKFLPGDPPLLTHHRLYCHFCLMYIDTTLISVAMGPSSHIDELETWYSPSDALETWYSPSDPLGT